MATLSKLKVGQVVYSIGRRRMGNTTVVREAAFPVRIISIDMEKRCVMASWNHNPPMRFSERHINRWRLTEPAKKKILG